MDRTHTQKDWYQYNEEGAGLESARKEIQRKTQKYLEKGGGE